MQSDYKLEQLINIESLEYLLVLTITVDHSVKENWKRSVQTSLASCLYLRVIWLHYK